MRVLFLGEKTNPVYKWLITQEKEVVNFNEKISLEYVKTESFNFIISYGYRHIISKDIILLMKNKIINLHISFLPYNRGSDPNFWSFLKNSSKGVTIHLIDNGIDTGDILVQKKIEMDANNHTLKTSYDLLNTEIQNLFYDNWIKLKNNKINPKKQNKSGSFHLKSDINNYLYLIEKNGWNTKCNKIENKF